MIWRDVKSVQPLRLGSTGTWSDSGKDSFYNAQSRARKPQSDLGARARQMRCSWAGVDRVSSSLCVSAGSYIIGRAQNDGMEWILQVPNRNSLACMKVWYIASFYQWSVKLHVWGSWFVLVRATDFGQVMFWYRVDLGNLINLRSGMVHTYMDKYTGCPVFQPKL